MDQQLKEKISCRTARVGIIGLGYVGLPLSIACADARFSVVGIDKNITRLEKLDRGESYIEDIPTDKLLEVRASGKVLYTDKEEYLRDADIILICVPTPIDEHKVPDLSFVEEAGRTIVKYLKKGQMIILESTVYPGCTEEFLQPILESSGFKGGEDFFLVYSPERVDPNNISFPLAKIPKVVGGTTSESTELAALFYGQFTPSPHAVSSPRIAEMCKILENMFRLVNISMINELALLCGKLDIDIWETIEAAKTKPYGFMPFYPGPGVGGHCISVDPFYLSWKAKEIGFYPRFIELAGQINDLMTHFTVTKVIWALNQHKKCLNGAAVFVIGVTYKRDVGDLRDSPALKIMADLLKKGALLSYHDPFIEEVRLDDMYMHAKPLSEELLRESDLVLILTDHLSIDFETIVKQASLIVDTRHAIKRSFAHVIT